MNIGNALAAISIVEKFLPAIEAAAAEIGPLIQKEVADGKAIWGDVEIAAADLRAALAAVKIAAQGTSH